MKILIALGIFLGCALMLYLFILFLKRLAEDHNKKKFKPQKDYLKNLKGGLK
jgi:hypothetical protein